MHSFDRWLGTGSGHRRIPAVVPCLEVGDRLGGFSWRDRRDAVVRLEDDERAGRVTVLLVTTTTRTPAARELLQAFAARREAFDETGAQLLALSADSVADTAALAERLGPALPLLSDPDFATGKALGLRSPGMLAPAESAGADRQVFLLDEAGRIEARVEPQFGECEAAAALAYCVRRAEAMTPSVVVNQAPVLVVPRLLSRGECARLATSWESGQRYAGGVADSSGAQQALVRKVKVREDVALGDLDADAQALFAVFRKRLFPEVRKAFGFHISRAETLRLGCYDARDGGFFKAHRDDTAPAVRHRRFAMSLFLNTGDYEGGQLRFPEYGPQLFEPPRGSAAVFSCSLLHEVMPVTAGRRFVLLGFFHGEVEEAERRARGENYEYLLVDRPAKLYSAGRPR